MSGRLIIVLIIVFHLVGLTGFLVPALQSLFKQLVPFHLLLMLALMIMGQGERNSVFVLFLFIVYIAGFGIELLGVRTGLIFGDYSYGSTLGVKAAGIPLMIGINWILVIYPVGILLYRAGITKTLPGALAGAGLVTFLDYLIEPVAVRFDYWHWEGGTIPPQNYIAWFAFSFLLLCLFYRMPFRKENHTVGVLFIAQVVFFAVLGS